MPSETLTIGELSARSGRGAVGAALLRARGPDPRRAHRRQPAPLRPRPSCAGSRSSGSPSRSASRWRRSGRRSASCPPARTPTRADWARLSARWRRRLDERIALLGAAARPADRLHRLRLPVAAAVPALQPRRPARGHRHRGRGSCSGQTISSTLPMWSLASTRRCASAASAIGTRWSITGRIRPSATSGQTCSRTPRRSPPSRRAGGPAAWSRRSCRAWPSARRRLSSALRPPWSPMVAMRPLSASASMLRREVRGAHDVEDHVGTRPAVATKSSVV